jgi:hypothetical protein
LTRSKSSTRTSNVDRLGEPQSAGRPSLRLAGGRLRPRIKPWCPKVWSATKRSIRELGSASLRRRVVRQKPGRHDSRRAVLQTAGSRRFPTVEAVGHRRFQLSKLRVSSDSQISKLGVIRSTRPQVVRTVPVQCLSVCGAPRTNVRRGVGQEGCVRSSLEGIRPLGEPCGVRSTASRARRDREGGLSRGGVVPPQLCRAPPRRAGPGE